MEALRNLEGVLKNDQENVAQLNTILDDLRQEDVIHKAAPIYAEQLYKARKTQDAPLTLEQVEYIVQGIVSL